MLPSAILTSAVTLASSALPAADRPAPASQDPAPVRVERGALRPDESRGALVYEIPSRPAPSGRVWWNRIRSVRPARSAWLDKSSTRVLVRDAQDLPATLRIEVTSRLVPASDAHVRMHQIQLIGTHNSYHVEPQPKVLSLVRAFSKAQADSIRYTHRPLTEQLERLGMRKFELDVSHDVKGGAFARPLGAILAYGKDWASLHPEFDEPAMQRPGMKLVHFPNLDFRSNTPTFKTALAELSAWSRAHNLHLPIMILIETKKSQGGDAGRVAARFQVSDFRRLEQEILEVLEPPQLLTPDEVRGHHPTLNAAVLEDGWPPLGMCRGRFVFALDNSGSERDEYLKLHPGLRGALLFVASPPGQPEAAFIKHNDPTRDPAQIRRLARRGYLIRTRADADLKSARQNSHHRKDLAFASGAQYISTDFPEPVGAFPGYQVRWTHGKVGRLSPLFPRPNQSITMEPDVLHAQTVTRRFRLQVQR